VFLKLALVSGALGDLGREGLRVAAVIGALVLVPVALVVIAAATLFAMLLAGFPGAGQSGPPLVPPDQLVVMIEVGRESGVRWELLAAIASVESDFGRNMATSSAGAIGYGQFLPSSWEAYGEGGDPYDFRDVLPAIARYLLDHGAPADLPNAVWAYNHSWEYVALVLGRASSYATLGLEVEPVEPSSFDLGGGS
jgi:transglycosylase-like protein with SLT domain